MQLVQARSEYEEEEGKTRGSDAFVQAVSSVMPLVFRLFSPF